MIKGRKIIKCYMNIEDRRFERSRHPWSWLTKDMRYNTVIELKAEEAKKTFDRIKIVHCKMERRR